MGFITDWIAQHFPTLWAIIENATAYANTNPGYIASLIGGTFCLVYGAKYFVDSASAIANKSGVPKYVVGSTIVAVGTSLPEMTVSIIAAFVGANQITVGNVLGSNVANIWLILGITPLIMSLPVENSTVLRWDIPILAITTALFTYMGWKGVLTRVDGIILLSAFVAYILWMVYRSKKEMGQNTLQIENTEQSNPLDNAKYSKLFVIMFLGGSIIFIGAKAVVFGAVGIARALGIDERAIANCIVAPGTSLPELVTSVIAALRMERDIAIGNLVGSNMCNILFVAGLTACITQVPFATAFRIDAIVALCVVIMLGAFLSGKKHTLGKVSGVTFLACYVGYIASQFI